MSLESMEMSLEPARRDLSDDDIRIWFWQRICGIGLGLRIRPPHLAPDRFQMHEFSALLFIFILTVAELRQTQI